MEEIILRDDFIKLGQAIKAAGLVESGVEAKIVIQDGEVKVNVRFIFSKSDYFSVFTATM